MSFHKKIRGTWLPYKKEPAASLPILRPDHIRQVVLPIQNEISLNCELVIEENESVSIGQLIAKPREDGGIPIYSTVSGIFTGTYTSSHPLMGATTYAIIECMSMDLPEYDAPIDAESLSNEALFETIRNLGIIDDLDGQLLADKLEQMQQQMPTILFANAIEDELYSCSAWATLREDHVQVITGLRLAARMIGAEDYQIAVALSDAHLKELRHHIPQEHLVCYKPDFYPHSELDALGYHNFTIGVQACRALYRAAAYNEPQTEGLVTVSGDVASLPMNVQVPFGTSLRILLEVAGISDLTSTIVLGDNMTGTPIESVDIPVLPGMTCVLGMQETKPAKPQTCINCGRCATVCHKHLLPYEIARNYENMQYQSLSFLHPSDCDGCNACVYICPAKRNVSEMVQSAAKEAGIQLYDWEVST